LRVVDIKKKKRRSKKAGESGIIRIKSDVTARYRAGDSWWNWTRHPWYWAGHCLSIGILPEGIAAR
jgi:hypothetical protein